MCGIFGVYQNEKARKINITQLEQATNTLRQRGPDDEGYLLCNMCQKRVVSCGGKDTDLRLGLPNLMSFVEEPFDLAFGFHRLSIIDLSPSGHQPMVSADGRYWIICNGEIYNYLELRQELQALGYIFSSATDTEVLLAAYREWKTQVLTRLEGMFAFAVLDLEDRSIFLARDIFGIKPLYFAYNQGRFAFASEIKALLELPWVNRQVEPETLYHYIRDGVLDYSPKTFFSAIKRLPPAHYLRISLDAPGQIEPTRYWDVDLNLISGISQDEAAWQLREVFLENVRMHLRSDVPVGAALSGGIDSSSIVTAMRIIQGQGAQIPTFTYIADDPVLNEEHWVEIASKTASAMMYKVTLDSREFIEDIQKLIYTQDEPFASSSIYAQSRVFGLAHETGIKVMLSGQGADELFGGYYSHFPYRLFSLLSQGQWIQARKFIQQICRSPAKRQALFVPEILFSLLPGFWGTVKKTYKKKIIHCVNDEWFSERAVQSGIPKNIVWGGLRKKLLNDFEFGLPALLRYEDHNSMAYSIESRVPFLTMKMVNFMFSLPEEYLIASDGTTKAIFRHAMENICPAGILERKDKIGFAPPERNWLFFQKGWVERVISDGMAASIPILKMELVKKEWDDILRGEKGYHPGIWRWLNIFLWTERFDVQYR